MPKPTSPYGASKLCGEAYCHAFAGSFGLSVVALRFANVYGPHSAHKRGAVTNFSKALLLGEPIVIFGDGSATRDFIHVDDVCAGIRAALDKPTSGATVLHLATGAETRIIDLARMMMEVAGSPDHPIHVEAKPTGELERNFAAFDRAYQVLGFNPSVALREGLKQTFEWFRPWIARCWRKPRATHSSFRGGSPYDFGRPPNQTRACSDSEGTINRHNALPDAPKRDTGWSVTVEWSRLDSPDLFCNTDSPGLIEGCPICALIWRAQR